MIHKHSHNGMFQDNSTAQIFLIEVFVIKFLSYLFLYSQIKEIEVLNKQTSNSWWNLIHMLQ